MTEVLLGPVPFLIGGAVVLSLGFFILVRGRVPRRSLTFFQMSLALALSLVVVGTLCDPDRSEAALRASGDLVLLLGLLAATTLYQFISYGLDLGPPSSGPRERRQGVILMWGISAVVGLLIAGGELQLVSTVSFSGGPVPRLRYGWKAVPVLIAIGAGIGAAGWAAGWTWRRSDRALRARRARRVLTGLILVTILPVALHLPGPEGTAIAGGLLASGAGAALLASIARLEPLPSEALLPVAAMLLEALRGPALIVARDGRIRSANETFRESFGHGVRDLVGEMLEEVVEDATRSPLPLTELSLNDDERGREVLVRTGGKGGRPARVLASALGHVEGEALPSLYLFEPSDPHDGEALETGPVEQAVRQAFRGQVPALAVIDPQEGRFEHVNDQFLHLTGCARQELLGSRPEELGLVDDQRRGRRLLGGSEPDKDEGGREGKIRRRGGDELHVQVHRTRVVRDAGDRLLLLARDVTAERRVEEELREQVLYDSLTGLPRPVLFKAQLEQALQRAQRVRHRVGLLLIDLVGFQEINRTYGESDGNQVLARVAWRLYECFRQMDTLCRWGDDVFAVLLEDLEDREGAAAAADRFRRQLQDPIRLVGEGEVEVAAAIGAAVSVPGQTGLDDLVRWAEAGLFRAKRHEGNGLYVYDPERDTSEIERLSRADQLRKAIEREELVLHYQPLVALATGRVTGAEALVRWPGDDGELRSPGEFLPMAEETGLIVPMSEWILREAARQAQAWREHAPDLKMSVNVAAQHFGDPALRDTLAEVLAETGLAPEGLQLEITEGAALRDARSIDRLRELGVRITVDDFGTGYSSLEYIRGLAVDGVKIDRAFVSSVDEDEKDQAIVRAVLLMAEAFELEVTAEGIETAEQFRWLREVECDLGQGFYFSRPMPAAGFADLLDEAPIEET